MYDAVCREPPRHAFPYIKVPIGVYTDSYKYPAVLAVVVARRDKSLSDLYWSDKNRVDPIAADDPENIVSIDTTQEGDALVLGKVGEGEVIEMSGVEPISVDEYR